LPAQSHPYLILTDGTTTVTVQDGAGGATNYPLARDRWAPNVAPLRQALLGGWAPYDEVIEEQEIHVTGADTAAALANLRTLNNLLDQAERWRRHDPVAPVTMQFVPQGSTIHSSSGTKLVAVVLGRAPGDTSRSALVLPQDTLASGLTKYILSVRLRLYRRGQWLGIAATGSGSSGANGTVHQVSFSGVPVVSTPVTLTLKGFNTSTTQNLPASLLLAAGGLNRVSRFEAESMTATGYTSVADAANNASGGSVLRYTPTGTAFATSGALSSVGLDNCRRFAIYAVVRNNSGTTTWRVKALLHRNDTAGVTFETPEVLIDTSTTNPRVVFLGELVRPFDITDSTIQYNKVALRIAASAASGTLDIDYIAFLALDDETSSAIALGAFSFANEFGGAAAAEIQIQDGSLTLQRPRVLASKPSGTPAMAPLSYSGNIALYTKSTNYNALWMCPNGANWRYIDATPAVLNTSIDVSILQARVTPE